MPGSAATKSTRAPGSRLRTSYGPTASSAVNRSNSGIAICMVFLSGLELAPVVVRADPETAVEGAPHRLDGAEAALRGDRLELLAGRLEPQPGVVHAQRVDVGAGRHADLVPEGAREVALAHAGAGGEGGDAQVGVQVRGHPLLELLERRALGRLGAQVRAELRLATGALDEHHKPAGGFERDVAAEVLLDEGEREVHAGGDPGRGPHVAVLDVDRLAVDVDLGVPRREVFRRGPVRRGAAAVEQAGTREHVCAGADGGGAARPGGGAGYPADEPLVLDRLEHAVATGHDERVERPSERAGGAVGDDRERAAGADRLARVRRDDLDVVRVAAARDPARDREDLPRPGHVERLGA